MKKTEKKIISGKSTNGEIYDVEYLPIGEIVPYQNNPRHNDAAVDAVAKSIKEFGFRQAIVVDENMVIICGHTRWKAANRLGFKSVPVHIARNLTLDQVKAYRLADNRTSELSSWDAALLQIEIGDLRDNNFDMDDFGFTESELNLILKNPDPVKNGKTDPDTVPEAPEIPVSAHGKAYRLGEHLLMCGDATSSDDVMKLMGESMADLWLTDPPYNVTYTGKTADALTIQNDSMGDEQFRTFLTDSFTHAAMAMKPGASYYIFHADTEGYNFRGACRDADLRVRQCLVWVKNCMVMGRQDYQWRHEPCLYGWKDGDAHNWHSDRCQTTVLEFNKPNRNGEHPTMKPVEMLVYLIKNSSQRGETVLDTFGGSGSTLIACEQTGRICRMMELDPKYCDVIRRRWAEFVHGENCDWESRTPEVC